MGLILPYPPRTPLLADPGNVPWHQWFAALREAVNAVIAGGRDADTLDGLDSTDFIQRPMPLADLPAHHVTHEPGGSDAITALDASVITSGTLPVARLGAGTTTVVVRTETGVVHHWAPGLSGDTVIMWTGTADLTVTGFAGGVTGQAVTVYNAGSGRILCAHASGASPQPLWNLVRSAPTPLANGGRVTYVWVSGLWYLVAHEQGAWITPVYSAADYTADGGGWTVEAGDVDHCESRLDGTLLTVRLAIFGSSVSGTPTALRRVIPGGFSASTPTYVGTVLCGNAGAAVAPAGVAVAAGVSMSFTATLAGGAWAAGTNLTNLYGSIALAVA